MDKMAQKTSQPSPAQSPSGEASKQWKAIFDEIRRGNLSQQSDMAKLLSAVKKDIIDNALAPLMRVVGAISKLISLMVMPFANLLIPLLLPILYFLAPIVKFLSIQLRPLFVKLMENAKSMAKGMAGSANEIMSGAGSGITSLIGNLGDMVSGFFDAIKPYVTGFVEWLIKFLETIDLKKVLDSIWKLVSDTLTKIWDTIAPSLGLIWDKIAPWLEENFPDLLKLANDIWAFVGEAKKAFGAGPGGLIDGVVAQAKFFVKGVSDFIFESINGIIKWVEGFIPAIRSMIMVVSDMAYKIISYAIIIYSEAKKFFANMGNNLSTLIAGIAAYFVGGGGITGGIAAGAAMVAYKALNPGGAEDAAIDAEKDRLLRTNSIAKIETDRSIGDSMYKTSAAINKLEETLAGWQKEINIVLVVKDRDGNEVKSFQALSGANATLIN